jgi:hypothetical protein
MHPPLCSSTPVRPSRAPLKSLTVGNVVSERVPLSIYVIADLDTEDGLSALRAALLFSVS